MADTIKVEALDDGIRALDKEVANYIEQRDKEHADYQDAHKDYSESVDAVGMRSEAARNAAARR